MGKTLTDTSMGHKLQNPFPGLRPFRPDESELFFGRSNETMEVLNKLEKNRFVTVIGASGSGKSSLIYCGVIPGVTSHTSKPDEVWKVISLRPGNDPVGAISEAFIMATGQSDKTRERIENLFGAQQPVLDDIAHEMNLDKEGNILLLVDQFEELFRYKGTRKHKKHGGARTFVNMIVDAVNNTASNIHVIITMRSDFIGECAHYQGLTELINNSNYLIPHMSADNYRQAILGPVNFAGAKIEEELVERLVKEIGEKTDQLPVLQHALMRTWDYWYKLGNISKPIASTDYDSVGQMSEAMSRHADEAYEELGARGQEICEVMFRTITEKGNDNKGIRHPTKVRVIADIARCSNEELISVIETFRAAGRSFITPPPGVEITPDTIVDVSHESLMRVWDRLAEWVDEEASSVQMYLRLSESSELFHQGKTSLWRMPDLQIALNWRNDNMPTLTWAERFNPAFERAMVYLRTSEKEYFTEEENKIKSQKRQLRRSRITAMILGSAAIISVFFMLYAFTKQIEAEKNRKEADAQKQIAQEQEQLAVANKNEAVKNAEEADLQKIRALENADEAKRNADSANVARAQAILNAQRASKNAEEARIQEKKAIENADEARRNEILANQQREEATRLRMLSIGKSMAVKSLQVIGQGDLQVLLAYQAFLFNDRFGGLRNDADIYMGLYNVAKIFGNEKYMAILAHNGAVRSIAFEPEGDSYYTSGADGKVLKWTLGKKEPDRVILENDEIMEVLSVSPDGKYLACGSNKSEIKLIPLAGGTMTDLTGHSSNVKSLVFSPDNSTLYSASLNGRVIKWDISTGSYTELSNDPGNAIVSLDISPSGEYLSGATATGSIKIWDQGGTHETDPVQPGKGKIKVIRFKNKTDLAVGYESGLIEIYNLDNRSLLSEIQGHTARVSDIRFNTIRNQMATCSFDGMMKLWNMNDLTEPPITFDDNDGYVMALAYSPDGTTIVSGSNSEAQNSSLVARPVNVEYLAKNICPILSRNFTEDEWKRYVGSDIDYETTCETKSLSIKVLQKKGD